LNALPPRHIATVASQRARLWDAGFRPVALKTGDKMPTAPGWTERARRDPPADAEDPPSCFTLNTGLLADGLRILDLDIDDAILAHQLRTLAAVMLGETLIRSRVGTGRSALLYRAAEDQPGKRVLAGRLGKVEVLGRGQQLHAFGLHPSGTALVWSPVSPDMTQADTLPAVTEDQISAFLAAAAPLIEALPSQASEAAPELQGGHQASAHGPGAHGPSADPLDVVAALAVIPPDNVLDWDHWNKIGMATWAATGGSLAGLAAWTAWTERSTGNHDRKPADRWKHFAQSPPTSIGAGTLFHLAKTTQPGWTKPSEATKANRNTSALVAVTAAELLRTEFSPRAMVLGPFLPEKGLGLIYGPRGIGKTHLTLGAAYAIATGTSFLRWSAPKPRRVLIIDGEMPAVVLQARLAAIAALATSEPPEADYLRFLALDMQTDRSLDLSRDADQLDLEHIIGAAEVVLIDNISTLVHGGRENEAESWLPVQQWALGQRRAGRSVLFMHHAGKGGQQRGTSRREDVLDTVVSLRRPADHSPDQGARFEVHYEKSRGFHGDDAKPFEAALGAGGWTTRDLIDPDMALVVKLTDEGLSVREVAEEADMTKSKAGRLLKKARDLGLIGQADDA